MPSHRPSHGPPPEKKTQAKKVCLFSAFSSLHPRRSVRLLLLTVTYDLAMSSHGLYSYLVLLISIPAVEENPRGKERFKALLLVWCFQKWKPRRPARGRRTHMLLANMWSGAPPPGWVGGREKMQRPKSVFFPAFSPFPPLGGVCISSFLRSWL